VIFQLYLGTTIATMG